MTSVFLDTVGLIALWDESDQWHPAAEQAFGLLHVQRARLVTTSLILIECGNAAARKLYRAEVTALRKVMMREGRLIVSSDSDIEQAWLDYEKAIAGTASIVDQISFVVMRRYGITEAFTNDRHYKAAGFNTLF
jgi:predicted nucleic acid-binding protein